MKNLLWLSCACCGALVGAAELTVPNGGFEEWAPAEQVLAVSPRKIPGFRALRLEDRQIPLFYFTLAEPDRNGSPGTGGVFCDRQIKAAGNASLRIENRSVNDITSVRLRPNWFTTGGRTPLAIRPNTRYRLRFQLRAEGLKPHPEGGGAVIFLALLDGSGRARPVGSVVFRPGVPSYDWSAAEKEFTTGPEDRAVEFDFQLRRAAGNLWYDQVELEELGPVRVLEVF